MLNYYKPIPVYTKKNEILHLKHEHPSLSLVNVHNNNNYTSPSFKVHKTSDIEHSYLTKLRTKIPNHQDLLRILILTAGLNISGPAENLV